MKRYNIWVIVEEYTQTKTEEKYKDIHLVKIGQRKEEMEAIQITNNLEYTI